MELGGKFWLMFIGGAIACAIAGLLVFLLIETAWARWGFFGMFLFLSAIFLAVGWIVDRRNEETVRLARRRHVTANADEPRSGLADAAGRAAFFPARAAARAWRGPIEQAVDEVLSAPEIARVVDRALAGSLPEEIARSLVRHRVLERIAAELATSGELERLVTAALATPQTLEITDRVLASDETQLVLRHVASSPELRDAIARQTTGLARRSSAASVRPPRGSMTGPSTPCAVPRDPSASIYGGIATRAIALATDAALAIVLFMSVVGIASLVASLVGGLRPQWLVGVLARLGLAAGRRRVLRPLLERGGADTGNAAAAVARPRPRRQAARRSVDRWCRMVGLVLAIVPLFAGFIPVLFTERRRGLPDFLAGTVVLYDDAVPPT